MSDDQKGTAKKPEQPTELSDQEMEQAAGGKAPPKTIYDQPGNKFE